VLSRENIERRGYFSADTIEELRSLTEAGKRDYTRLLWSLFTLEVWMQEFRDGLEGSERGIGGLRIDE